MKTLTDLLGEMIQERHDSANESAKPVQFDHDPLVLSCESYLLYRAGQDDLKSLTKPSRYHELRLLEPTERAVKLAHDIRRYYLDSLVFQRLRNQQMSQFRTKLYHFLMDAHQLKQDELGLVYKLPYFYEFDQTMIAISESTTNIDLSQTAQTRSTIWALTPLRQITREVQHRTRMAYWWQNEQGHAVSIEVDREHRDLDSMIDGFFSRSVPTKFQAVYRVHPLRAAPSHHVWWMNRPRVIME